MGVNLIDFPPAAAGQNCFYTGLSHTPSSVAFGHPGRP